MRGETSLVALVTGASSELGERLAQLFARDGHDVVLVGRNAQRLDAVAERLRFRQVKTWVLEEDLSKAGSAQRLYETLRVREINVHFLVNNPGWKTTGPFLGLPIENELKQLQSTCASVLELTHRFGSDMKVRGSGRILNIASTAGFQPGPYMATSSAAKAFVVSFSEALARELRDSGVTVTCACPGLSMLKMEDVAADAYEAMMEGEVLSIHGLVNWAGVQSLRLSPRALVRNFMAFLNKREPQALPLQPRSRGPQ